jgi:hypothetical protein
VAVLTLWAQTGWPQAPLDAVPPTLRDDKPPPLPAALPATPVPPPDIKLPTVTPAPAPAPPPTVEDLIKHLEHLRKQKADLEAQEKAVVAKLQERLKDQSDRLNKLGINLPGPPIPDVKDREDRNTPLSKR